MIHTWRDGGQQVGLIVQLNEVDNDAIIVDNWMKSRLCDGDLAICKQLSGDNLWTYALLKHNNYLIGAAGRRGYRLLGPEFKAYTCGAPYKFQPTHREVRQLLTGADVSLEAELPKKIATKHPMQPIVLSPDKIIRFMSNQIVCDLLSHSSNGGRLTLNDIGVRNYSKEDREQFFQLLGMSVSTYGSLPFVSVETRDEADRIADEILAESDSEK